MSTTLDGLGIKYESDKCSLLNDYLRHYESLFKTFRNRKFCLVEFSDPGNMTSAFVWKEYFKRARIIEVIPAGSVCVDDFEGVVIEIGDQNDPAFLRHLATKYNPLIVIDDGFHFSSWQILSFEVIFPHVQDNGLYIIEDMNSNFHPLSSIFCQDRGASTFRYLIKLLTFLAKGTTEAPSPGDLELIGCLSGLVESINFIPKAVVVRKRAGVLGLVFNVKSGLECDSQILKRVPSIAYDRCKPLIFDAPKSVVDTVNAMLEHNTCSPPAYVAKFKSAFIFDEGIVIDSKKTVVRESLINIEPTAAFAGFHRIADGVTLIRCENLEFIPMDIPNNCMLLTQLWDQNYGHWLIESLSRLTLLDGVCAAGDLHFLIKKRDERSNGMYIETLAALGYTEDRISWFSGPTAVKNLLYASPLTLHPQVKSPLVLDIMKIIRSNILGADETDTPSPTKLYVSRNLDANDRILLNEEDVIKIAIEHGFVVIHPGLMSFAEQVRVFGNAQHVIGNLGAGLTNIVFSNDGLKLLAITSEHMMDDFFWDLVSHKQGAYWSIHGKASGKRQGYRDDFTIDIEKFAKVLESFLQS